MLSAFGGSLHPGIREGISGVGESHSVDKTRHYRCLSALYHVRSIAPRVNSSWHERCWKRCRNCLPKDSINRKSKYLAPRERFLACPRKPKTVQGAGDLKAIVEPIPHRQVSILSRQNDLGAEPVGGNRNRLAQRLKNLRKRIAYLGFGDKGHFVGRNVNALDPTERFHLADEWLIDRVPPKIANACKIRSADGPTSHQMVRHRDYR